MATTWKDYAVDAILRDGTSVHIRAIRPGDRAELARGFAELSPEAVYFRFFRVKQRLTDQELEAFTELDFTTRGALVATRRIGDEERIIATARYAVTDGSPMPPHRAEVAFTVGDAFQGRGLGTLLLEHLVVIARASGVTEFEADVLGENNRMLRVFAKSGFRVKRSLADGVFHVTFPTRETDEHAAVTEERERAATARSLRAILAPRAVAVVGASRTPGTIGAVLVDNLRRAGFTGPIYPVNPHAETIAGLRCHPTVEAIGAARRPGHHRRARGGRARRGARLRARRRPRRGRRLGGLRRRVAGRGRARARAGPARARLGHAAGRTELHGRAEHRSGRVAQRHLRPHLARGRTRRHALAERGARPRRFSTTSAA